MITKKKVMITQSNYIPWKGFFDSLSYCDTWVVYDEMQFTRRDWRNRNQIKTPQGLKWLTIPVEVKGKFNQKINDTKIADVSWNVSHWQQIKQNYSKAECFKDQKDWLEHLFLSCTFSYLTEINLHFISQICEFLKIQIDIVSSSDFELKQEKTDRLVHICEQIQATDYYSGPSAKNYMDEDLFKEKNIEIHYWDYLGYNEYNQLYKPFTHGVSILDLILCEGQNSNKYLKYLTV